MRQQKLIIERVDEVKDKILDFKKIIVSQDIADYYRQKLELTVLLFDFGAKAFKFGQEIIIDFDTRILNEYQYFSRAQATLLKLNLKSETSVDSLMAIDDAFMAVRYIVNDTLDLISLHIGSEIKRLNKITELYGIQDVYSDYATIRPILREVEKIIADTREQRGVARIDKYIDIMSSGKYEKMVNFCYDIEEIEGRLKRKKRSETKVAKRWMVGILVSVVIAAGGFLIKAFVDR